MFGRPDSAGLTQASGEVGTGSQQTTFDAMTQFLQTLLDPFTAGRDGTGTGAPAFAEEGSSSAYASQAASVRAPSATPTA